MRQCLLVGCAMGGLLGVQVAFAQCYTPEFTVTTVPASARLKRPTPLRSRLGSDSMDLPTGFETEDAFVYGHYDSFGGMISNSMDILRFYIY